MDEVRIKIPNGYMTFRIECFLAHGKQSAIRKFLKMLRDSEEREEWAPRIMNWLKASEQEVREYRRSRTGLYLREKDKQAASEERYSQMKSPCYAIYTTDKEVLKKAKQEVSEQRERCRIILSELRKLKRQEERYQKLLEMAKNIFGGGET